LMAVVDFPTPPFWLAITIIILKNLKNEKLTD
jgi:hypothetical protein